MKLFFCYFVHLLLIRWEHGWENNTHSFFKICFFLHQRHKQNSPTPDIVSLVSGNSSSPGRESNLFKSPSYKKYTLYDWNCIMLYFYSRDVSLLYKFHFLIFSKYFIIFDKSIVRDYFSLRFSNVKTGNDCRFIFYK